jgi:peptidoglycan biosynthesis protein MviN/MurJ (putative lipid II flippase)
VKLSFTRQLSWKYSGSLFFSGVNTFAGVVFQFGTLYKLGVGVRSDLYFASIMVPLVIFSLGFGGLNNVLIPLFVEAKTKADDSETTVLWNCLLGTLGGGTLLLALLYYPTVRLFPLLFHKLAWIDVGQVGRVVVVYSVYQILFSAGTAKNCYLFAQERPVSAQMSAFWGWLLSLIMLARLHSGANLSDIAMCMVGGSALALVFPNLEKGAFRYQQGLFWAHMASLRDRTLPLIGGAAVSKIEPLFDGVLASLCREGSLTVYYLFSRVMMNVVSVTFAGYMQPAQKALAEMGTAGGWERLRRGTRHVAVRSTLVSLALLAAGCAGAVALYFVGIRSIRPYIRSFDDDWLVFLLLIGYLVGMVVSVAYANSLFIIRKERLFMVASLAAVPLGVLFKFLGAYVYNLGGLAVGTSLYWILYAAILAIVFSRTLVRRGTASSPARYAPVNEVHIGMGSTD